MNLSKSGYTVHEYKILGYNLNFVPTPENIDKKELLLDIVVRGDLWGIEEDGVPQVRVKVLYSMNLINIPKIVA